MLYNNANLEKYCEDNNIKLLDDYTHIKINRDSFIKGICIIQDCNSEFNKTFRQLEKTGGYCHDCTIENVKQKSKEKCKYNYNSLKLFCNENNIYLNGDYDNNDINRDTIIYGKCINVNCNNEFNKIFRQLIKLNGYCFDCCKEIGKQKGIQTNLEKYGVDNPMKNNEFKEKQKETIIKLYGVEHISQLPEIKEQKIIKSLKKYGTEYVLQSEEIKNKTKKTNILKYGFENPQQNKVIKDKTIDTMFNIYGSKSAVGNFNIRQKMIENSLKKYGVPHHSQNAEVADLMLKNTYTTKKYIFPSGKIIVYQGYENFAFEELINIENILEEDIITNRKDVPEIWYFDNTNKKRRHYVDMYIPSQNRCIEVKSSWTNQEKNNVLEKQQSAINLGYKYEIWIFDKKGNKLQII